MLSKGDKNVSNGLNVVYERTCHICDAVRVVIKRTLLNIQRGKQLSAIENYATDEI